MEIAELNHTNYREIRVEGYTMAERLGSLKFENANVKLEKIQAWLKEAEDLGYKEELSVEGQRHIEGYIDQFIKQIKWLSEFDLAKKEPINFGQEHDNFESRVDSFYNEVQTNLAERYLPFLWLKAARETGDYNKLQEELVAASKARKQAEEIVKTLQVKLDEIEKEKKKVESGALGLGSKRIAIYFEQEADQYRQKADQWFKYGRWGYGALVVVVVVIIVMLWNANPGDLLWQRLALKGALFALLWYGVAFIARSYNVNSHLAAVNRHRAAVARTLEDFLLGDPKRQTDIMWKNATEAMFKHLPVGYVTKSEKDSNNPLMEVIYKVINPKSE